MSADDETSRETDGVTGESDADNHDDDTNDDTQPDDTTLEIDTEMSDSTTADDSTADTTTVDPQGAPDIETLQREIETLRADLDSFEEEVESRTVDRPTLKTDLEEYTRKQLRRGKARGWGPYLILLYGTATTIAAFYLLDDLVALVAMIVTYLSTLGLYALFVLFGIGFNAVDTSRNLLDRIR